MCFTVELSRDHTEMSLRRRGSELLNSMTLSCPLIKFLGTKFVLNSHYAYGLCSLSTLLFWCRCGWGTHPFPSRTRRLRPNRPMVLHWRRCGRAGGRQIKKKERNRRSCLIKIERALESELCWEQSGTRRFSISPVLTLNQSGRTVIIAGFYQ